MNWIRLGVVFVGVSVILGAFGAHVMKDVLSDEWMAIFEKAVYYQAVHGLALCFLGILEQQISRSFKWVGRLFCFGIIVFSGSLYSLVCFNLPLMGAVTPVGGVSLIVAWGMLLYQLKK